MIRSQWWGLHWQGIDKTADVADGDDDDEESSVGKEEETMIRSRLDRCCCPPGLTYSHVTQAGLMMIMMMVRLLLLIIMIIMVMMIVIMILLLSSGPEELLLLCNVLHQAGQMRRKLKPKVYLASIGCSLIHVNSFHFCLGVALISPVHKLLSRTWHLVSLYKYNTTDHRRMR